MRNISLEQGWYILNVTDDKGCQMQQNVFHYHSADPFEVEHIITPNPVCDGETANLTLIPCIGNNPCVAETPSEYTYTWSGPCYTCPAPVNNQNNNVISNLSVGLYFVTITNSDGCETVKHYYIESNPAIEVSAIVSPVTH